MGAARTKTMVKVYKSVEELPELLEPGRYIVEGVEITVYEPTGREELVYQLRKIRKLVEKYGSNGWI